MIFSLPFGSLTETEHSTEACWRIAERNLIVLSEYGSHLHGINGPDSDRDFMGVCIEPANVRLGFTKFSMYQYRTQPTGEPSGKGDVEITVHGLRKWVRLAAEGDFNAILLLFTPAGKILHEEWPMQRIRFVAHLFITRAAGHKFGSYVEHNLRQLVAQHEHHVDKPKYQSHVARIAMQGIDLMLNGTITLPMKDDDRELLLGIRSREVSQTDTLNIIAQLNAILQREAQRAPLPAEPSYDAISKVLVDLYTEWWSNSSPSQASSP